MRDLDPVDLGVLLSVFAVLLLFFGFDFRVSRRAARLHQRSALTFGLIGLIGEAATAVALVLTWIALFLTPDAGVVDTILVFVPGSVAVVCAVVLTLETVVGRVLGLMSDRGNGADRRAR